MGRKFFVPARNFKADESVCFFQGQTLYCPFIKRNAAGEVDVFGLLDAK